MKRKTKQIMSYKLLFKFHLMMVMLLLTAWDGAAQQVTGTVTDEAGGTGTDTVTVMYYDLIKVPAETVSVQVTWMP